MAQQKQKQFKRTNTSANKTQSVSAKSGVAQQNQVVRSNPTVPAKTGIGQQATREIVQRQIRSDALNKLQNVLADGRVNGAIGNQTFTYRNSANMNMPQRMINALDSLVQEQNRQDRQQRFFDRTDEEGRDIRRQLYNLNRQGQQSFNADFNPVMSRKADIDIWRQGATPQDIAKADEYRRERNAAEMQRSIDDIRELANRHPALVGTPVSTFGGMVGSAITPIATLGAKIRGDQGIDVNDPIYRLSRQAEAAREGTMQGVKRTAGIQDFDENGNRTFASQASDFLVGTGLSMSDTLVRSAFMGPLAGAAQAGFSAASQRFIDGKMNGEDDRHALASALAQGVAEDFFEKYSLEGLHALKSAPVDGLRSLLLNMGKQGFTEGSEEFATDWANAVSDYFINGGDSEWARGYNECRQAGMTDEQAIMSVAADTLKQSLISFGGGALSGILLGGGAQLANRSVNNQLGQQLQNEGQGYTSAELAEIAQNMDISPENFTDVRGNLNREALEQAQDAQAYLEKLAKRTVNRELTPTETGAAYRAQSDVVDATVNNMTDAEIENLNKDIEAESNRPSTYWSDKAENRSIRDNIRGGFDENGQKAFDALSEEDAVAKARPFAAYYNNGRFGTEVSERMEELGKEVGLTADEISAAVRAGAADANKLFPTQESIHLKQTTDGIKTKGRQGKVKYQGIKYGDLTTQQKMRADFTSAFLNKGLGMDVVFVRSNVVNGKYQGFNGAFEVVNGRPTITIDVNAGMNAETDWTGQMSDIKTLLPVVSHELTHYLETANSEAYHQIAQEVINTLQTSGKYSKGLTFNEILNEERIRLEQTEGRQRTNTDAMHEIVARACEDMLSGNKEAMEAFEKMKPATRKTIADHIKDIFDNIRDFFEQMLKGYRSDSSEAKAIRSNMEKFEKIRDMWNQAINDSLSIVQADDVQTADTNDGMQAAFSLRQFAQSLDYDLLINKDGLPFQIIDPVTQQPVTHVTEEHMHQTPMGVLVNAALANGTIDSKTASKQLKMFTDLMNLTLKYDDTSLPMVWEIAGTYLFSSVKTNSDAQYSTTVDYGTICSKTQALIDVLSNTMVQKGRGLTREEVMTAYNRTARQGLSVPCPVCYVFSRWMGVPSLLETMRNCQERFGNASKAEIDSYIKSMVKEYGDAKAINSEKTKVQNRMATLERKLQKASADKDTAEEKKIAKETQELQQKLTDLESFNWVTQVRCKSDGKGGFIPDPAYKSVPNDILLDLRKSGDFASKYPKAWKYRTTRGAGMGKAIMPYSGASIGDFIKGNKDRWSDSKNPFTTKNVKSAKSAVARAVIRAKAQNLIGGQRFQSTSDYRAEWGIDYLMTFLECQAAGSQVQLYTKVIEAVDMLASAGAECNLSIMPKDNGYIELANGKKQLVFSDVTGINFDEAYKKTTQYDNVQMILVGINDEHIRLAMADDRITFIIPWHSSGNSKDTLAQLMESVGETLDVAQNVDYSDTQTDKVIDNSPHMQRLRQFRKEILQGKLWDNYSKRQAKALTAEQNQLLDENAYLKELYRRFYQDESAQEYGVKLNGKQVSSIFPYEYWDKSLTIKDADQNGRRFQDYCASLGIQPRFSQFADDHGYWKLLIDRKMYNVDGTYHTPEAINVTNVKVEQIPMAVNSNNYKDMDKIAQATRDTLMALDGVQNDLQAVDTEDEFDSIEEDAVTEADESVSEESNPAYTGEYSSGKQFQHRVTESETIPGTNENLLNFLNKQIEDGDYITTYKAFLKIGDTYYSPMASLEKDENGNKKLRNGIKLLQWLASDGKLSAEDIAKMKMKEDPNNPMGSYGYYILQKSDEYGNHIGDVEAAYNPYQHSSDLVINDQFQTYYARPGVVVVECRIPKSEIDNPYWAPYAKDPTGKHEWKSGSIARQLEKTERSVYMTRYIQPVRELSDKEVAEKIRDIILKEEHWIDMHWNVLHPGVVKELESMGITIEPYGSNEHIKDQNVNITDRYGNAIPKDVRDEQRAERDILKKARDKRKAAKKKAEAKALKESQKMNIEQAADDPNNDNVIRQGSDKDIQYSTRITDKNINDRLKVYMATFFSGTGTVDFALRNIVRHEFAVEYDAKIAAVYRANNGDNIYVNDVRDVDINPHKGKVEYFHASPVCKSYSNANNDQGEKPLDIETAQATADAIDTLNPKVVTVENVAKYRNSEAIKLIEDALERNGYEYDKGVYRASDFGGATIRERMFLRAVKDGTLPEIDTSEYEPMTWYEAVEDLIPSLPKAEFSNYMEERLDASGIDINNLEAPIFILGGNKGGKLTWASADEPAPTILAKSTEAKIVMTDGSVLRATPRVMARIQGLPDSFDLKDGTGGLTNAYKVVGNGVPVQLTQGIVGPLLEQNLIKQKSESTGIQYSIRTEDGDVYRGITISDADYAYSEDIKNGLKLGETRDHEVRFLENVYKTGERIALIRSGVGNFKAYATTKIGKPEFIPESEWESRRADTRVPKGSTYDQMGVINGKRGKKYYPFVDLKVLDEEVTPTSHSPVIARFDSDKQYAARMRDDYAPTFYSKLQREIGNFKGDKIGAASVESYLKGKGVKDEEIKWSGIRQYLEGKKSVNKQELMDYLKANELQIDQKFIEDIATEETPYISTGYEFDYADFTIDEYKRALEWQAEANDEELVSYERVGNEIHYSIKDYNGNVRNEVEHITYRKDTKTRWSEYSLKGGENYREILFMIPGSDYTNRSMNTHWGKAGVLAHARVQDFNSNDGGKVLFVEEIQSDWHNAGQKYGYDDFDVSDKNADVRFENGYYELYVDGKDTHTGFAPVYLKTMGIDVKDVKKALIDDYKKMMKLQGNPHVAPDAPFRNNYTDFVLKDLLRMAAEGDYDYLAWTTADMQSERWSGEYAEGYRIEYDQDIPKFLKKYGKQWGAGLTNVTLDDDSNSEVPAIAVNDAMKESVLYAGQPMFSQRNVDLDQRLDDLIQTYGALPKGEMAVNDISVPQQTSNGKRVRRYARTVLESGVTSDMINDEIKEKILKEGLSYEPVTDKSAAEYAASVLRIGGVTLAQKEWDKARRSDTFNKDHMAVGQELLREYAKQGDVENVINMVTELAAEGTRMGQNIQAMRMLKKYATQAPAVGLGYIQRTVDIMNREAKKKMGKRYKEMKIDQQLADAYINASTKDEIDAALAKIYINLGSQVQKTAGEEVIDRLRTWRYMSMLGNPRTHVRNLVGNALFVPAVNMKNIIGATIESTFRTKERTKSLITSKAARQFAAQDAVEMQDILQGNADKSIKQRIMDERKTFTLKPVNVFSKLNGDALEAEDWVFLRYHYQNALAQYITANKLNPNAIDGEDLAKARQYAVKEAQKATYRDANKVSTWLNQSKGAGAVVKYMMEGMMPFKKTPTNILRRGIEYSPAMIVGSLTKGIYDLNHGNITVNEWIDGLSSGLTGTAIFGLGLFLASTGAILGGYKDDDDKEKRKLKGEQEYAVKIGNHTYTIDWAAPGSLPLFVGVETMYALRQGRPVNMDDISKAAARLVDPMINMSMLSGLNDTLDAISYADDKLSTLASETFFNLLGQYVPTLFGQVARTMDTTQRVNYQDVNKGMPKNMLYFLEKMQNKIPYMTFSNDPYLDAFGRENTTESRFIAALQNFVFPWYTSELSDDRVVRAVTKLQDRTEEKVLPQKMPKYLGQGDDRMDLTSRQYYRFQKTAGTMSYNIIDSMLDDDRYLDLNADQQAEAIKMGYDYAKAAARLDLQPEYELKGDSKKIYEAYEEDGTLPYDTILDLCMLKNATEGVTGDPDPNKEGETIYGSEKKNMINAILESDGSAADKAKMYEMKYPEDKLYQSWKKNNYSGVDYMKHYSKISMFKGDKKQEQVVSYIWSQTDDIEKQKIMFQMGTKYELDSTKNGVVTPDGNFLKKMGYTK